MRSFKWGVKLSLHQAAALIIQARLHLPAQLQ